MMFHNRIDLIKIIVDQIKITTTKSKSNKITDKRIHKN